MTSNNTTTPIFYSTIDNAPKAIGPYSVATLDGSTLYCSGQIAIDPATGKATRTGRKLNEQGKLQRYSKETGKFIADPSK